jgi:hypothetical protein
MVLSSRLLVIAAILFSAVSIFCLAQQGGQDMRQSVPIPQELSNQPVADTPLFTFKAVTSIVVVDLVVRDKEDNPVQDLTSNDLQISEKIGDSPAEPQKIASLEPVTETVRQKSTKANGIVLGWLHKSFCPLTGAYELTYYLSPESRKDGSHRILISSSRPGLRLFFRQGYGVEAEKLVEGNKALQIDEPKQQTTKPPTPQQQVALIACYDTMNVTNFPIEVRKVNAEQDSSKHQPKPQLDTYEFHVLGSYFVSLAASARNHPLQLDFSLCRFTSGGQPLHYSTGTVEVGANPQDYQSLNETGLTHRITVERQRCTSDRGRRVCDPPLSLAEIMNTPDLSARFVVRNRETGAIGSAEILLVPLGDDQFPQLIPEDKTNDSFGTLDPNIPHAMCGDVYQLAPWTTKLPLFSELDAVAPIYAKSLAIYSRFFKAGIPNITSRTEWFGVNYQGSFGVDLMGKYEFDLLSDDGAKVYIDDKLIVSDDSVHSPERSRGNVQLIAGTHSIRVSYFQGPRTEVALVLLVKPPGRGWRLFDTSDFPTSEDPARRRKLPSPERSHDDFSGMDPADSGCM